MTSSQDFKPDWVSPPGDTIAQVMRKRGVSISTLDSSLGEAPGLAEALLGGVERITLARARILESVLGASLEFWMARDAQYHEDAERLYRQHKDWLEALPLSDMVRFGWVPQAREKADAFVACLRYFGVSSPDRWNQRYRELEQTVLFRRSESFEVRPSSVAAWLRQGEIATQRSAHREWNAGHFAASLAGLRSLTRENDPKKFVPQLLERCAASGVVVVIAPAPQGCPASGATWFADGTTAVLMLSARYLSDDHFWFSFFHEAAHLLLHRQQGVRFEGLDSNDPTQEAEANNYAADVLVPESQRDRMLHLRPEPREVISFAREVGVSAGIVVGQMQHHKVLRRNQLNGLRRRYRWE